ncbi:MAG: hypothetical protein SGPRY_008552 [Prymnesium sp.]
MGHANATRSPRTAVKGSRKRELSEMDESEAGESEDDGSEEEVGAAAAVTPDSSGAASDDEPLHFIEHNF